MTSITRRGFLRSGALAAATAVPTLRGLVACSVFEEPAHAIDYGPLVAAGPELALPAEFTYTVLSRSGRVMSDARRTPGAFDGMAAFQSSGTSIRLIRNHENRNSASTATLKGDATLAYDVRGGGAVTALDISIGGDRPALVHDRLLLSGTIVNCAGGQTPWGS